MASLGSTMPAFDTHKAVKALCEAGFDDVQAEAVVDQINGAITERLASKEDLDRTESNLSAMIESLATKVELRAAIEPLASKEELRAAIEPLATKAELRAAIEPLATKAELRAAIEPLATKEELAQLELRMTVKLEELTGKMLKYMGGGLALVVAAIKGIDLIAG